MRAGTALVLALFAAAASAEGPPLQVGSKRFTESYVLAELAVEHARQAGEAAAHQEGLGGTAIVFRALEQGSIDLYPEYTGTIAEAILQRPGASVAEMRKALEARGIGMGEPLGFDNTYALAVPRALKEKLGLETISQLARHPELKVGVSHEFLGRADGWPGLVARYGLSGLAVEALDHGLAYEAMSRGAIQVMDVYSTDAKLKKYDLSVLKDDRHFFPSYQAVYLYRLDAPARFPGTFARLRAMAGTLDEATMIELNGQVELEGKRFSDVARAFVAGQAAPGGAAKGAAAAREGFFPGLWRAVVEHGPRHLLLVALSLLAAIAVGIPLGVLATRSRAFGQGVLAVTGVVQTIPSLALLCFFIPLLGTGTVPALAALFLYALLPIVRNTAAGLQAIPTPLIESAEALGLPPWARLWRVRLPLAAPLLLAGVKTSAVINVGAATLAAFIGAGGFGQPISIGLNLNDTTTILQGAIPAAMLALLVQGAFDLLERVVIPRGLRLPPSSES